MWLDMYMRQKFYVKNWEHDDLNKHNIINISRDWKPRTDIPLDKVCYIETESMYWRKANAIHKWFVDNVQDSEDDCWEYYVSHEQLQRLHNLCKTVLDKAILKDGKVSNGTLFQNWVRTELTSDWKVISNPEEVKKYLPCEDGPFFWSTDYDEYYFESILETYQWLDKEIESEWFKDCTWEYYYSSSW